MSVNRTPFSATLRWLVAAGLAASPAVLAAPAEVMTLEETAEMLRVPARIVARMAGAGNIPARQVGEEWRFSRSALAQWLQGERYVYPAIPAGVDTADTSPKAAPQRLAAAEMSAVKGGTAAPLRLAQAPAATPASPPASPPASVGERPTARTAEEVALREQVALLKKGAASVELDLSYSRQVRESFGTLRLEQNAATASLTGRYGLKDDLQITGQLPGIYRRSAVYPGQAAANAGILSGSTSDAYLGDLSLSLLGVAMRERTGRPNVLLSLDGVLPTGGGDKGLGAGITVSKSYDPVVIYGGASYMYGFDVDPLDDKRILAKHNWGLNLGYAYAVNDSLALSGVLSGIYRTPRVGLLPPERESWQIQLGMTWQLAPGLFMEPAIGFGIGGTSPDMTLSLSLPYTF